jgi:MerR family transcriptional regulator, light-induced transcriptional regulator
MTPEPEPSPGHAAQPVLTVAAVARRLGVAPSTLRTWDRRYGLGPSAHTAGSHRRYGPGDLRRLTVMRALTLEGVPPAEAAQIALSHRVGDRDAAVPVDAPRAGLAPDPVRAPGGPAEVVGPAGARPVAGSPPGDPDDDLLHLDDAPGGHRLDHRVGTAELGRAGSVERLAGLARLAGAAGAAAPAALTPVPAGSSAIGATVPVAPVRPYPTAVPTGAGEPGRGSALWFTDPLPAAPRPAPPAEGLRSGDVVPRPPLPGGAARAGGGRVLSLPDASPRARGLARAAMALDTVELARLLRDAIAGYGVGGAWNSMIVPVLQGLGERWQATGECVDVEHAFSEAVLAALRGVTGALHRPRNVVPVLLAGAEGDQHGLPLHVMAAALAEEEVGCRMLGTGLPARHLVAAARRTGPAVVFLYARLPVPDGAVLRELPRQRPAPRVLVGGPGWAEVAVPAAAVRVGTLSEALTAVLGAACP